MQKLSWILKSAVLSLFVVVIGCLALASLGGVFESTLLVYSWYIALFGMVVMIVLAALLVAIWLVQGLSRRYRRFLSRWSGERPARPARHSVIRTV